MPPPLFFSVRVPTKFAIFWRAHLASESSKDSLTRAPISFLIIRLDDLGDVVLTTPLFRELKRAFPESFCTLVVQDEFRPLLVTNPYIDEIIGLPRFHAEWLPAPMRHLLSVMLLYRSRLRGRRFDVAISPRWDLDDRLATFLCALADAKDRVGYSEMASPAKQLHNRGFDAAFSTCLPAGPVQHEVLRNLEIVNALGGKVEDSRLEIKLTQRDRAFASKMLANVPASTTVVAVGIGGRRPGRRWPLENYAEALTRLGKERHVQPVIICSGEEKQEASKLAALLPGDALIVSGAPLRKVCAVLERCNLFVGNDSGSAHLAGAMNRNVIVVSRHPADGDANHANSPIRFAPFCDRVQVLQPATGLDRCTTECSLLEPHCITTVTAERVAVAAREMLARDTAAAFRANLAPSYDDNLHPTTDRVSVALKKVARVSEQLTNRSENPW